MVEDHLALGRIAIANNTPPLIVLNRAKASSDANKLPTSDIFRRSKLDLISKISNTITVAFKAATFAARILAAGVQDEKIKVELAVAIHAD